MGTVLSNVVPMRRLLALTIVFGLLAVACSPSDSADGSTTTSPAETTTSAADEVTTSAPTAETTTSAAPTTTVAPASTTTSGSTAGGGDDCLVGTWELDSDSFVENFTSIFADAGMPDADISALDGTFIVDMNADGTYDAVRDAWGFSVAMAEGTVTIEINGTESGTWSTDADVLSIQGDTSDLAVDSTIEVDGQVVPLPEGQFPVDTPSGIATDSTYDCSGDVLTLTNDGIESVMNRA